MSYSVRYEMSDDATSCFTLINQNICVLRLTDNFIQFPTTERSYEKILAMGGLLASLALTASPAKADELQDVFDNIWIKINADLVKTLVRRGEGLKLKSNASGH